ncbi:MarR family transcriptional regulator [Rathayibacter sp. CAU 1779]
MGETAAASDQDERARRRVTNEVKRRFRDVNNQIALLSHHVSAQVELRDVDLDCLDFLAQHGPTSPGALARRAGVHPATMTGVIDRLEKGGWIQRERAADDRRAIVISARREAIGAVFRHYDGMNSQMDAVCDAYSPAELELIAGFLQHTADAGRRAVAEFSEPAS